MSPLTPSVVSPFTPAPPSSRPEWAVVDVETSGLRAREHRVLSLAVVVLRPDGERVEEFSTLLDPGCDPGPVHVHGLTRRRLRGAPTFDAVAERVAGLLRGRVFVAHNAHFDHGFLVEEFARLGVGSPVERRMCTLALNRRIGPPTSDLRLATLAAHYGVRQLNPHDALDDARTLVGVLRGSLSAAETSEVELPVVPCVPGRTAGGTTGGPGSRPARTPRAECAFLDPGRPEPGGPLVQGMKVVFTGATVTERAELARSATAAGLDVMNSVSRRTSLVVCNDPAATTGKARRARTEGVPVVEEAVFLRMLGDVRPGTPRTRT